MKVTIRVERRPARERVNQWGVRKARKLRRKVVHSLWGSSYPERGSLAYGSTWLWVGSGWQAPADTSDPDDVYVESDIERNARDLVEALDARIAELEDPCR